MRIRDLAGAGPGILKTGASNSIADVLGVKVGHCTIEGQTGGPGEPAEIRTGVTAVVPHSGNLFRAPVPAAVHIINGFGKAIGLAQLVELGLLETPILLSNTLCAGRVADSLTGFMLDLDPEIGDRAPTVNPVVAECNDGFLNTIRTRTICDRHVREALEAASTHVAEGAVGAGTGMVCFGWKGGIGTSSRVVETEERVFTVGVLALTNFGRPSDLAMLGVPVGRLISPGPAHEEPPAGSVVVVLATDAPLDSRQLGRVARRCEAGLARTGSFHSHGSGDFVIAFSTRADGTFMRDSGPWLDPLFRAAAEATEESVYNSLLTAKTTTGRLGRVVYGLGERAGRLRALLDTRTDSH